MFKKTNTRKATQNSVHRLKFTRNPVNVEPQKNNLEDCFEEGIRI